MKLLSKIRNLFKKEKPLQQITSSSHVSCNDEVMADPIDESLLGESWRFRNSRW